MQANDSSSADRRQSPAGRHRVNKQQSSLQTRLATPRGNKPTTTGKTEQETDISEARLQSQPRGPTAEPAKNHKHTCTRSCTNTHSSHGSLGAVIIIYREQLGPRSPSFIWFSVIMICDHHHSGLIKEHQGDSQQVCFLHPQAKHLMSQLGKYLGS